MPLEVLAVFSHVLLQDSGQGDMATVGKLVIAKGDTSGGVVMIQGDVGGVVMIQGDMG